MDVLNSLSQAPKCKFPRVKAGYKPNSNSICSEALIDA